MTLSIKERAVSDSQVKDAKSPVNSGGKAELNPRSNPVCLEVGVTIRSLPGAAGADAGAALPVREESRTVIVFDNGAVLRLSQNLPPGQTILLANTQGHEVACRIVNTRKLPNIKGYVEVEFVEPAGDFWGIHQKPDKRVEGVSAAPAPAPPTLRSPELSHTPPTAPVKPLAPIPMERAVPASASTPAPAAVKIPAKATEVSIPSDGAPTFEDISELLPLSSGTRPETTPPNREAMPVRQTPASSAKAAKPVVEISKPAPPLQPSAPVSLENTNETENERRISAGARSQSADFAGIGRMSSTLRASDSVDVSKFGRLPLIGGAVALLVLVVSGGFFLMNRQGGQSPVPVASVANEPAHSEIPTAEAPRPVDPPSPSVNQAIPATPAVENQSQPGAQSVSAISANTVRDSVPMTDTVSSPKDSKSRTQPEHAISGRQPVPNLKLSVPTAPKRDLSKLGEGSAPSIAEAPSSLRLGTSIPSATRADNQPAPPQPVAAAAASAVSSPRLISSSRVVYPETAKLAKVQGTVVVSVDINESGKVTGATVISGPTLLRSAAVNTVMQWKYQPALRNGTPTRSQTTVSLDFKLN